MIRRRRRRLAGRSGRNKARIRRRRTGSRTPKVEVTMARNPNPQSRRQNLLNPNPINSGISHKDKRKLKRRRYCVDIDLRGEGAER